MRHRRLVAALALLACAPALPATAQHAAPAGYPAVPLLSTGTTVLGETIRYPAGDAHVTAAIVTLAPGQRTILHEHDVPLFAYILEGEMTVDYGPQGTRIYQQGQSIIEAMGCRISASTTATSRCACSASIWARQASRTSPRFNSTRLKPLVALPL